MQLNEIALAKIAAAPVPTAEDILRTRISIINNPRAGGDLRGNATSRRARTAKLLAEFGDGQVCPCIYCGTELTAATLTQDKIYTCSEGGGYRYANLLPACIRCNQKRSDATIREFILDAQDAIDAAAAQLSSC